MAFPRALPSVDGRPLRRLAVAVALALAGLVAPLVVASAPASAGAPDLCQNDDVYRHVCEGYRAYARRNPTTDELEYWALQSPFPRTTFNSVLGKSLESRRATVRAYYDYFGGYAPDPASLTYWQGEVLKLNGLRRLEAALLGGYVGMIDGFLDTAFPAEIGRDATQAERDYWGTRAVATSRTKVAAELSATLEARRAKVRYAYDHELDAVPDPAGHAYWAERLRTGTSYLELRIALRHSQLHVSGWCSFPAPSLGQVCL
jgi:hypothetical protein